MNIRRNLRSGWWRLGYDRQKFPQPDLISCSDRCIRPSSGIVKIMNAPSLNDFVKSLWFEYCWRKSAISSQKTLSHLAALWTPKMRIPRKRSLKNVKVSPILRVLFSWPTLFDELLLSCSSMLTDKSFLSFVEIFDFCNFLFFWGKIWMRWKKKLNWAYFQSNLTTIISPFKGLPYWR